jgi:hypothetical protein
MASGTLRKSQDPESIICEPLESYLTLLRGDSLASNKPHPLDCHKEALSANLGIQHIPSITVAHNSSMSPRIHQLQRLQGFALSQTRRTLPRYVHQSAQRNVALQSSSHPLPTQQPEGSKEAASARPVLGRLPTSTVLRSYLITRMSSSPALLSLCFTILRRMLDSKSYLMSIERNPVLSQLLKKTFYAQFCVGEKRQEVVANTTFAREVLGYNGILFEYALEVLGGATPTAAETAHEIEVWRKGMLQSVDMAKEGDFVGLKYVPSSPLPHHLPHILTLTLQMVRTRSPRPPPPSNPTACHSRDVVRHPRRL